jgi:membrane protein DedA with SNARE-associated domain
MVLENALILWVQSMGYAGVFLAMVLESACIPIPSEIIMPFAGYLAWSEHLQIIWVIVAGTLGNVVGSLIAYYVGKVGGRPFVIHYGRAIRLSEKHLQMAERWFEKRGEMTVLVCRLLPGVRTFISLPAGISNMPVIRFTAYSAVGSLPWVAALAYGGYKLGQNWGNIKHFMHPFTYIVGVLLLVAVCLLLLGKWRNWGKQA